MVEMVAPRPDQNTYVDKENESTRGQETTMHSQASRAVKEQFSNYDSISGRQPSFACWTPREIESVVGTAPTSEIHRLEQQQPHIEPVMQRRGSLRIWLHHLQWSIDEAGMLQVSHDVNLA